MLAVGLTEFCRLQLQVEGITHRWIQQHVISFLPHPSNQLRILRVADLAKRLKMPRQFANVRKAWAVNPRRQRKFYETGAGRLAVVRSAGSWANNNRIEFQPEKST